MTYKNIWKVATGQGNGYTTCCLLDYPYFKEHYKLIAKELSKNQKLDANPKATQQINFAEFQKCFSLLKKKELALDFSKESVRVLWFYFVLIYYQYKMTRYITLNVKLSNSQLNKLKSGIKSGTEIILNILLKLIGNYNDETNFSHKLLLTSFEDLQSFFKWFIS